MLRGASFDGRRWIREPDVTRDERTTSGLPAGSRPGSDDRSREHLPRVATKTCRRRRRRSRRRAQRVASRTHLPGRAMAELSRVRGADTEEQLLELQRAFLASSDHRANAAARVQRVGGAPPRPPTEDETAGQLPESIRAEASARGGAPGTYTTASFDDGGMDEDPAPQPELRDVVREVVERPVGRAPPAPPAPPVGGTGLPFPAATHRTKGPFAGRKSKFMAEREARRAAAVASGAASSSLDDVAPAGSVRVGGANVSFQMMPPPTSGAPGSSAASSAASRSRSRPAAPADESAGVEEETARRLAAMSVREIEDARAALAARLKPESLAFLKARSAARSGAGAETGTGTGAASDETSPPGPSPPPPGPSPPPPGPSPPPPGPSPPPPGPSPPASPPRGRSSPKRARRRRRRSRRSPVRPRPFDRPRRPRARAAAAAANSIASGPMPTEVRSVRYALDGAPLRADDHPAAQRAASRLGSATERDLLRAGHQGARDGPGYTLGEALDLARSSVPAQRVAGLGLVAKVLTQARRWGGGGGPARRAPRPPPAGGPAGAGAPRRRSVGMAGLYGAAGAPSNPLSLPPPLPAGVAWGDVWLHALVDHNAVFLLRRAMDDAHLPASSAATAATAALLGASRGAGVLSGASGLGGGVRDAVDAYCATDWYDALECAPRRRTPMTGFTEPLWRSGGWGATFAPLTWEATSRSPRAQRRRHRQARPRGRGGSRGGRGGRGHIGGATKVAGNGARRGPRRVDVAHGVTPAAQVSPRGGTPPGGDRSRARHTHRGGETLPGRGDGGREVSPAHPRPRRRRHERVSTRGGEREPDGERRTHTLDPLDPIDSLVSSWFGGGGYARASRGGGVRTRTRAADGRGWNSLRRRAIRRRRRGGFGRGRRAAPPLRDPNRRRRRRRGGSKRFVFGPSWPRGTARCRPWTVCTP